MLARTRPNFATRERTASAELAAMMSANAAAPEGRQTRNVYVFMFCHWVELWAGLPLTPAVYHTFTANQ